MFICYLKTVDFGKLPTPPLLPNSCVCSWAMAVVLVAAGIVRKQLLINSVPGRPSGASSIEGSLVSRLPP